MNIYDFSVREVTETTFRVRADSPEEGMERFSKWVEENQDSVNEELVMTSSGWELKYKGLSKDQSADSDI